MSILLSLTLGCVGGVIGGLATHIWVLKRETRMLKRALDELGVPLPPLPRAKR